MSITTEEINKIAKLAKMEITETEAAAYARQLGSVLDWVEQLKSLDASPKKESAQACGAKTHEDKPRHFKNAGAISDSFNDKEGNFLKVKKVL